MFQHYSFIFFSSLLSISSGMISHSSIGVAYSQPKEKWTPFCDKLLTFAGTNFNETVLFHNPKPLNLFETCAECGQLVRAKGGAYEQALSEACVRLRNIFPTQTLQTSAVAAPTAEAHNLLIFQSTRQGLDNTSKVQPVSSGFLSELITCNVQLTSNLNYRSFPVLIATSIGFSSRCSRF